MRWKFNTSETVCSRASRILIVSLLTLGMIGRCLAGARANESLRSTQDVRELSPNAQIEQEIRPDQTHVFSIRLAPGEFLHLRFNSCAVSGDVDVRDADNNQLFSQRIAGVISKDIFVVAEKAGEFRVRIKSFKREGNPKGRYELSVLAPGAATAEDKSRVSAQRLDSLAAELYERQTQDSLTEAIVKDLEAAKLWGSLGEQGCQSETLDHLGTLYYYLGEKQKAIDSFQQAVSLSRTAGDGASEAAALVDLGVVLLDQSEPAEALKCFNQALPLRLTLLNRMQVEDRTDEAMVVYHIGCAYRDMGEYQKALISLREALPLWSGDGHAYTLHMIGGVYARLGEAQKAIDYHSQAAAMWRGMEKEPQLTEAERNLIARHADGQLVNIGAVYASTGQWKQALENYENALLPARKNKLLSIDAARILSKMGYANLALGNFQKALDNFDESLPVLQRESDRVNEAATMRGIGEVHAAWSEPQKALEYFDHALSLERSTADQPGEAATLFSTARVHRDMEELKQARVEIELALNLIETTRSKVTSPELRASYLASKQDYYEFYVDLLMRLEARHPNEGYAALALRANERSRARSLLDVFGEAGSDIRQGVDPVLLERERAIRQRLNVKADNLTRMLNGKNAQQNVEARREVESLLTEYQETQAQIRVSSPRYAALTQPQPMSLDEIQQKVLDPDTLLLEYALGRQRSYVWAVTATSIKTFELGKRADIEAAARAVYELLARGNKREVQTQIKLATAQLSQMILEPVAGLLGNKRLLIVSDECLQYVPFAALPAPVTLDKARVIATGSPPLSGRRVSDLDHKNDARQNDDYKPLIVDHEIVNLPSVSALAALRRELADRRKASMAVAVIADPVLQADDPRVKPAEPRVVRTANRSTDRVKIAASSHEDLIRSANEAGITFERLPYTRQEADAIAALGPKKETLEALDFDASRSGALNADLGQYRIVHFATHGLINSVHPELSGLVLSLVDEQGRPQDGFLRLEDVYNLKLGADLVVLSACRTALGKEVRGEGLMGLTRGFMYAGAARVVASLWDVKDESTAELMKRFYQGMLRDELRPVAALRAAQVSMLKEQRWAKPYYWAAFTIEGEWR
jgi:CHAT domain-containing protein/Tfp pilus assembly protein PilF